VQLGKTTHSGFFNALLYALCALGVLMESERRIQEDVSIPTQDGPGFAGYAHSVKVSCISSIGFICCIGSN
jgi:hypothetical protein